MTISSAAASMMRTKFRGGRPKKGFSRAEVLRSLEAALERSSNWGHDPGLAWVYGVVHGFNRIQLREFSERFGWDQEQRDGIERAYRVMHPEEYKT